MVTNHFDTNGISTVILNYCKALDSNKYDLSVLVGCPVAVENKKECEENGINIVELPSRHRETLEHYYQLWKTLKKNKYDIVHVHGSSSMMAIELTLAWLAGVKYRIAHSHNSMCPNMLVQKVLNPYFRKIYTKALACGVLAGEWIFGKDRFEVLPNGFHTEQFVFDKEERLRIRKELNLEGKFVIGHMGRFNEQKNQIYLIRAFEVVAKRRKDAVLLLVGTGPDFESIRLVVEGSTYRDQIILYGVTTQTRAMYCAMDIFVLPSRYEGLPVVLLEAQMTGLPCVVSDKVTREVDFGDIRWESIDDAPEKWADAILNITLKTNIERQQYREQHLSQIKEYDILCNVKQLESTYDEGLH